MKKVLSLLMAVVLALNTSTAYADSCATGLMPLFTSFQAAKLCSYFSAGTIGVLANNTFAKARNAANSANLNIWKADGSDNTHLNAGTGKTIDLDIAVTPVVQVSSSGLTVVSGGETITTGGLTVTAGDITDTAGNILINTAGKSVIGTTYVPTAAATPVTGTNLCGPGPCVIPTNASNNAVFIGAATPIVNTEFYIKNGGANTVRAKVAGGATINGAVAGGYIGMVTGSAMHCIYLSATDLTCDSYATAGGTTAALPTPAGP